LLGILCAILGLPVVGLETEDAIFGLSEVCLETEDFILVLASDDIGTLLCLGLHSVNTSVSLHLDAFDARTGLIFDLVDCVCRLSQLVL
jgi:hypothetical protein